jgi:GntR family transcriptional regulator
MLPFSVSLAGGLPIYEQVIYAVTRAVVTGQLRPGDPFPSVRAISQELKINPNTAHKIVAALVTDGVLVVRPGIGTVVAGAGGSDGGGRQLVEESAERLVIESRRAGLSFQDVIGAIRRQWARTVRPSR